MRASWSPWKRRFRRTSAFERGFVQCLQKPRTRLLAMWKKRSRAMTQGALPFVHLLAAKKGFAIAAFLQIDGEDDGGRAGRLSTLDDGPANFPYICRIELLPNWPAAGRDDIFDRGRGDGGQHYQVTLGFCRSSHAQFTIGMEGLLRSDRR